MKRVVKLAVFAIVIVATGVSIYKCKKDSAIPNSNNNTSTSTTTVNLITNSSFENSNHQLDTTWWYYNIFVPSEFKWVNDVPPVPANNHWALKIQSYINWYYNELYTYYTHLPVGINTFTFSTWAKKEYQQEGMEIFMGIKNNSGAYYTQQKYIAIDSSAYNQWQQIQSVVTFTINIGDTLYLRLSSTPNRGYLTYDNIKLIK